MLFPDEKSNKIFDDNNKLLYQVFSESDNETIKKRLFKYVRTAKFNVKYLDSLELKEVLDNGHVVIEGSFGNTTRKAKLDKDGKIELTNETEENVQKTKTVITHSDMEKINERYVQTKKMRDFF